MIMIILMICLIKISILLKMNKGQHLDNSIINEERSTEDKTNNEKQPEFYSYNFEITFK